MITNGQPYITYEQLILLYRLCLVEKWFGLKFENGKIKATGMWKPMAVNLYSGK